MLEDEQTSRKAFLKKLGLLVGAGVGVSLVGAHAAWAQGSYCCLDTSCGGCRPGELPYLCHDSCSRTTCCACSSSWAQPCQYELPCGC